MTGIRNKHTWKHTLSLLIYEKHKDVVKKHKINHWTTWISVMPGKPSNSDELVNKKFKKATRKERKMICLMCKTSGHNNKGCSTLISCALMYFCYWILPFLVVLWL